MHKPSSKLFLPLLFVGVLTLLATEVLAGGSFARAMDQGHNYTGNYNFCYHFVNAWFAEDSVQYLENENDSAVYEVVLEDKHEDPSNESDGLYTYILEGGRPDLAYDFFEGSVVRIEAGGTVKKSFRVSLASPENFTKVYRELKNGASGGKMKMVVRIASKEENCSEAIATVLGLRIGKEDENLNNRAFSRGEGFAKGEGFVFSDDEKDGKINNRAFFKGEGFILSDDEKDGKRISLAIFSKNVKTKEQNGSEEVKGSLFGKAVIDGEVFRLEGYYVNERVDFSLLRPSDFSETPIGDVLVIPSGSFSGTIKSFKSFKLLRGAFYFNGNLSREWTLVAMATNPLFIKSGKEIRVRIGEGFFVGDPSKAVPARDPRQLGPIPTEDSGDLQQLTPTEDGILVKPIKVKQKKILGIIPTRKEVVFVEVLRGPDKIVKAIDENSERAIKGYRIRVGAVEGDKVDLRVDKIE